MIIDNNIKISKHYPDLIITITDNINAINIKIKVFHFL